MLFSRVLRHIIVVTDGHSNKGGCPAAAGGGIVDFAVSEDLAYTVHSITVQATRYTVELLVNEKLKKTAGTTMDSLPPVDRSAMVPFLEKMAEQLELWLVLLIDASGSMAAKKERLEQGVRELLLSLGNHSGCVRLAVVRFPGRDTDACIVKPLSSANSSAWEIIKDIRCGGITPTGPAISYAVSLLSGTVLTEPGFAVGESL